MRLLLLDYRASILVELPEAACLTAVTGWLLSGHADRHAFPGIRVPWKFAEI